MASYIEKMQIVLWDSILFDVQACLIARMVLRQLGIEVGIHDQVTECDGDEWRQDYRMLAFVNLNKSVKSAEQSCDSDDYDWYYGCKYFQKYDGDGDPYQAAKEEVNPFEVSEAF